MESLFGWVNDLINGFQSALSGAFAKLWETVSSSIWDFFLQWIYRSIFDTLADFFTLISEMSVGIFDLSWVEATVHLFLLFGWALFVAGVVVCVFDLGIEQQTGRANVKTTALNVLKGFFAVNLFTVIPIELYRFSVDLQNTLSRDLSALAASEIPSGSGIGGAATAILSTLKDLPSIFNLLAIIALGYCVIKLFFDNIKRGGILLIQIAVGSLYMFSVPRGFADGFFQWTKQVVALCLTAFLQTTLLFLGLLTWPSNLLLGLGIIISANEVPRIAQHFGLDTSTRFNMMNVVHTTQSAVNMTRSLFAK